MKQIQTWILCIFVRAISGQDGRQFPSSRRVRLLGAGKIRSDQEDRLREKFSKLNTTTEFSQWNTWREENGLLCRLREIILYLISDITYPNIPYLTSYDIPIVIAYIISYFYI